MLSSCLGYVLNATCILSTLLIVSMNLMGIMWTDDDRKESLSIFVLYCTQFTFNLILRPRVISRLGIHPYWFYYTYRDMTSMDANFYSILQSKVKISLFCLNGQPTNREHS